MPSNIEVITMNNKLFVDAQINGHYVYRLPFYNVDLKFNNQLLKSILNAGYKYSNYSIEIENKIKQALLEFINNNPRYFFENGKETPTGEVNTMDANNNFYNIGDKVKSDLLISVPVVKPMATVTVNDYLGSYKSTFYTDDKEKLSKYYNINELNNFTSSFTDNTNFQLYGIGYKNSDGSITKVFTPDSDQIIEYDKYKGAFPYFKVHIVATYDDPFTGVKNQIYNSHDYIIENFETNFTKTDEEEYFPSLDPRFPGVEIGYKYKGQVRPYYFSITQYSIGAGLLYETYPSDMYLNEFLMELEAVNIGSNNLLITENYTRDDVSYSFKDLVTKIIKPTTMPRFIGIIPTIENTVLTTNYHGNTITVNDSEPNAFVSIGNSVELPIDGSYENGINIVNGSTVFHVDNRYRNRDLRLKVVAKSVASSRDTLGRYVMTLPSYLADSDLNILSITAEKNIFNSSPTIETYNIQSLKKSNLSSNSYYIFEDETTQTSDPKTIYIDIPANSLMKFTINQKNIRYSSSNGGMVSLTMELTD